ncbi:Fc.00g059440.m01.CDS01 [Cosmosporella sp. VM-42]
MAEPTYTVFIRVPMPRGDFVDPPPVNWDSRKDEALWKILSGAAKTEIDWNEVADRFEVPVDFLFQQVAYLTERHASQVRAQVRKATAAARGSTAPSPIPGADSAGPGHQRALSSLSVRRDSALPRNEAGSGTGTPLNTSIRPVISRNPSTNTTIMRDMAGGSSSPRPGKTPVTRAGDQRRRLSSLPITSTTAKSPSPEARSAPSPQRERSPSPGPAESSSANSSEEESSPAQSRIIRRPPRYQQQDTGPPYDEDEDDESEPAFQPYKAPSNQTSAQDLGSTLRGDNRTSSKRFPRKLGKEMNQSQNSDSSASSAAMVQRPGKSTEQRNPGPLSPRRVAELDGRSPGSKSRGYSREGSDGTPSMGSSFSDLDDASVTQSALEEALASHMNRGAASSRFSISQAFRSRYTPNSNP